MMRRKLLFNVLCWITCLSCSREYCYQCREKATVKNIIAPPSYGSYIDKCNYTKSKIRQFEKESAEDDGRGVRSMECCGK